MEESDSSVHQFSVWQGDGGNKWIRLSQYGSQVRGFDQRLPSLNYRGNN